MVPRTSPFTITWEPTSLVGFKRMGFISTDGLIPAASACITWALPISSPSSVIKEFSAIFWDLKGATLYPSCLKILQSPAARRLFPALDIVPCTIIAFAIFLFPLFSCINTYESTSSSTSISFSFCSCSFTATR